jgi:hypothetical protein
MNDRDPPTQKRQSVPSVMFIGVATEFVDRCRTALAPMPVIRAAHAVAAAERAVVTRPVLIVLGPDQAERDMAHLADVARAVGAEIVQQADLGDLERAPAKVEQLAATCARRRSGQFVAVELNEIKSRSR